MSCKKNESISLRRRSFLKTGAASLVPGLWGLELIGSSSANAQNGVEHSPQLAEYVYSGVCRGNCAGTCFLNVHVRDGKVVQTSARSFPEPEYNRICIKGLTHSHRIYHAERLKYPLKRVGERGEGKWQRISWDEAITTIAGRWKGYEKDFGVASNALYIGSGQFGVVGGAAFGAAVYRFLNVLGFTQIAACVDAAVSPGIDHLVGKGVLMTANEGKDLLNAKTIFVWGANPVNSQQQNTHFLLEAKEKGTKLVVIDPVFTATAAKADMYVPIKPGTDAALAMAIMNIVVRENWLDLDFIHKSGVVYLVKESTGKYLRLSDIDSSVLPESKEDIPIVRDESGQFGPLETIAHPLREGRFEVNGHQVTTAFTLLLEAIAPYTAEKAAEICNLPVQQIEELAKLYATNKPSTVYTFYGMDHWYFGHHPYKAIVTLAILTGNIGKKGAYAGINELLGLGVINMKPSSPEGAPRSAMYLPIVDLPEILAKKRYGDRDVTLKSLYITHADLLGNSANRRSVLKLLSEVEFIVATDMNMNETAKHADILLPVAHWFEQEDIAGNFGTTPYFTYQEKCIDPLYECKTDYEIYRLLTQAMGKQELFSLSESEYLSEWLDSDGARKVNLTFERLKKEKALRAIPEDYVFGKDGKFATPSGRAEIYRESFKPRFLSGGSIDFSKEALPYWEPPREGWHGHDLAKKYPFILLNVHPKWRTHTQWWDVDVMKELDREPTMHINPIDAQQYDIQEGDIVKIFNDRGFVVMKTNINDGMQPGCISVPKGWQKHQFIDGHYQDLTSNVNHPMTANSAFFDVLVAIEKVRDGE